MKIQKQIDVRLNRNFPVNTLHVVQYDTGVQLVFNILDFDLPSGTTATLYVQKMSGKFVYQETGITTSGNTVIVNLENQAITEHGKTPYQLSFKNGSDVISSFTGLMIVEKSLKDAGATESKTVIRAFDEAVSDHVAEFQTKAEQIVQACIATIPEDYTAMEAKVNELANAVKGYLSGAVVVADDVSLVEHSPVVKVHGKNLVVCPYAEESTTRDGITWTIDEADNGLVVNGTATQNTSFNISMQAQKNIPLKKGKKYTFSCTSDLTGTTGYVYLQNVSNGVVSNSISVKNESATFTATADGFAVIGAVVLNGKTFVNEKLLIQLEEGSVATGYEPYIDPSTITVFRHGKNLAYGGSTQEITQDGITVKRTKGSSVFTINGTTEKSFSLVVTSSVLLSAGTYTASVYGLNNIGNSLDRCYVFDQENGKVLVNTIMTGKPRTFTLTEPHKARIEIVFGAGSAYSNKKVRLQMEYGGVATDYVECEEATTHIPAADGTVSGITSLSPNMTILTDTVGATVDCEYNRDTNKVIDKLINAITALGGTV